MHSRKKAANSYGLNQTCMNQILEVPKLGQTPRAHLAPIWPDLAEIWMRKIDFGNLCPSGIVMNVWGVTFGG